VTQILPNINPKYSFFDTVYIFYVTLLKKSLPCDKLFQQKQYLCTLYKKRNRRTLRYSF